MSSVQIPTSRTIVLAPNPNREYAAFVNNGADIVRLELGNNARTGSGIRLTSGASYEINKDNPYYGIVTAISEAGTNELSVTEKGVQDLLLG